MKLIKRETINNKSSITFILGENARDNHRIIDDADKNDWWFHIDDKSSSHCIVEVPDLTQEDIIFATDLIKSNTRHDKNKKVNFCYTQIKNIKKTKNPGQVKLLVTPKRIKI